MFTVSDIVADVERGCLRNNMVEDKFSYRLVYFINSGSKGRKLCLDTQYDGLRAALEKIVRENLTATNSVVLAAVTARKNGEVVSLLSRSFGFSLNEYFQAIYGRCKNRNNTYNNRYAQAIY